MKSGRSLQPRREEAPLDGGSEIVDGQRDSESLELKLYHAQTGSPLRHSLDNFVPLDSPCENSFDDICKQGSGIGRGERVATARRENGHDRGNSRRAQLGSADSDNFPNVCLVVYVWCMAEDPVHRQSD